MTVRTLVSVATALGATLNVRLLWQGEALDRLLDAGHAELVDRVIKILDSLDWEIATEVSFNVRGERGSIDILAFHRASGSLLVIEVKSVVPDMQAMLFGLDRKGRVAPDIARERGWAVTSVSRLLVLPDDRTARRRVAAHAATFRAALPARTAEVKRWLKSPSEPLAGILFLPGVLQATARHRIGRVQAPITPRVDPGVRG
jgi:hypothetical protein